MHPRHQRLRDLRSSLFGRPVRLGNQQAIGPGKIFVPRPQAQLAGFADVARHGVLGKRLQVARPGLAVVLGLGPEPAVEHLVTAMARHVLHRPRSGSVTVGRLDELLHLVGHAARLQEQAGVLIDVGPGTDRGIAEDGDRRVGEHRLDHGQARPLLPRKDGADAGAAQGLGDGLVGQPHPQLEAILHAERPGLVPEHLLRPWTERHADQQHLEAARQIAEHAEEQPVPFVGREIGDHDDIKIARPVQVRFVDGGIDPVGKQQRDRNEVARQPRHGDGVVEVVEQRVDRPRPGPGGHQQRHIVRRRPGRAQEQVVTLGDGRRLPRGQQAQPLLLEGDVEQPLLVRRHRRLEDQGLGQFVPPGDPVAQPGHVHRGRVDLLGLDADQVLQASPAFRLMAAAGGAASHSSFRMRRPGQQCARPARARDPRFAHPGCPLSVSSRGFQQRVFR